MIRAAVVGRAYILQANRAKWDHLQGAAELTLITPPELRRTLGSYAVERSNRWPHTVVPALMSGRLSGFFFSPGPLWRALKAANPDLIQVDEEPVTPALLQVLLLKRRLGCKVIFFSWENLALRYRPIPTLLRRLALHLADGAIAGNRAAADLLRTSGFRQPLAVIPQLGVDPDQFRPARDETLRREWGLRDFTAGYIGRLVPEKGLMLLLDALAQVGGDWQWLLVGRGPLRQELEQRAAALGLAERLRFVDAVGHAEVPRYLNVIDTLVLPSQTTPRWAEQFGHVLIEAMACGVPVVGARSGAIPEVIGDDGLLFPEHRVDLLAAQLRLLRDFPALQEALSWKGRNRVLEHYSDARIAEQTLAFWHEVCAAPKV